MKKRPQKQKQLDEMPEINFDTCKVIRRGSLAKRRIGLAALRGSVGLTQAELARRAKISQSEISRMELRRDCLMSTLARYAKALDGELEIIVKIDGREYPVVL